ncbi:MAG: hypothetical protein AAF394_07195, partial [Planctomycetota bacterium]
NLWNANKFTTTSDWSRGDINSDGVVDISDYNLWNANKFQSSSDTARGVRHRIHDVALSELESEDLNESLGNSGVSLQLTSATKKSRESKIRNLDWIWMVDHDDYQN